MVGVRSFARAAVSRESFCLRVDLERSLMRVDDVEHCRLTDNAIFASLEAFRVLVNPVCARAVDLFVGRNHDEDRLLEVAFREAFCRGDHAGYRSFHVRAASAVK